MHINTRVQTRAHTRTYAHAHTHTRIHKHTHCAQCSFTIMCKNHCRRRRAVNSALSQSCARITLGGDAPCTHRSIPAGINESCVFHSLLRAHPHRPQTPLCGAHSCIHALSAQALQHKGQNDSRMRSPPSSGCGIVHARSTTKRTWPPCRRRPSQPSCRRPPYNPQPPCPCLSLGLLAPLQRRQAL